MGFYGSSKLFYQDEQSWLDNRTGGATVKNATYEQILSMVKEDCSQFQQPKGDPKNESINWRYVKAEQPNYKRMLIDLRRQYAKDLDSIERFNSLYGDPSDLTDEAAKKLYQKIESEGIDPQLENRFNEYEKDRYISIFKSELNRITDAQKQKVIDTYGQWDDLDRDQLYEFIMRIADDREAGRFELGE